MKSAHDESGYVTFPERKLCRIDFKAINLQDLVQNLNLMNKILKKYFN